jgi:hypothetical protein
MYEKLKEYLDMKYNKILQDKNEFNKENHWDVGYKYYWYDSFAMYFENRYPEFFDKDRETILSNFLRYNNIPVYLDNRFDNKEEADIKINYFKDIMRNTGEDITFNNYEINTKKKLSNSKKTTFYYVVYNSGYPDLSDRASELLDSYINKINRLVEDGDKC